MENRPLSGPSRPFSTISVFDPPAGRYISCSPFQHCIDMFFRDAAASERGSAVGLGLDAAGAAQWTAKENDANANARASGSWKGKEREIAGGGPPGTPFSHSGMALGSAPSTASPSDINRPFSLRRIISSTASPAGELPLYTPQQTPSEYPARRQGYLASGTAVPMPPLSYAGTENNRAGRGRLRDITPRPGPDLSRPASPSLACMSDNELSSSAGSSRSVSSSSAQLSPRPSPNCETIELGLDALTAFGGVPPASQSSLALSSSVGSTPTMGSAASKGFGFSSPSRLFSPRAIPYRRIAGTPREPDTELCTSSSFRRSPLLKHDPFLLPTTSGSPRLRGTQSPATSNLDVEEEVYRAKSRLRSNKVELRKETRKKRRRDRVCGLAGIAMLLVVGVVVLLVRQLRKPASWHPSPRHGQSGSAFGFFKKQRPGLVMPSSPERDTIVLYRIIGNDLPPRHSPRQTLTNLRFLLENENDFGSLPPLPALLDPEEADKALGKVPDGERWGPAGLEAGLPVEKFYVLNRLANVTQIESVRSLLRSFGVDEHHILDVSFEWDEYNQLGWRWDEAVGWADGMEAVWGVGRGEGDHVDAAMKANSIPREADAAALEGTVVEAEVGEAARDEAWLKRKEAMARLRALDFTYHQKNLYAMNNVRARKLAACRFAPDADFGGSPSRTEAATSRSNTAARCLMPDGSSHSTATASSRPRP